MARTSTTTNAVPTLTATANGKSRNRAASAPLTRDRAMACLSKRYDLRLCDNGEGWYFALVTDGERRLIYRLGGASFGRFLRRAFPGASSRLLDRVARRCRFLAWLGSSPSLE
jgi:hypothetical protein